MAAEVLVRTERHARYAQQPIAPRRRSLLRTTERTPVVGEQLDIGDLVGGVRLPELLEPPVAGLGVCVLQQRSTFAGHGRSYGQGDIFRRDGQLVASFVQDAMIRARAGKAGAL